MLKIDAPPHELAPIEVRKSRVFPVLLITAVRIRTPPARSSQSANVGHTCFVLAAMFRAPGCLRTTACGTSVYCRDLLKQTVSSSYKLIIFSPMVGPAGGSVQSAAGGTKGVRDRKPVRPGQHVSEEPSVTILQLRYDFVIQRSHLLGFLLRLLPSAATAGQS